MKDRGIHVAMRLFLISGFICSAFLYSGCSPKPPSYADKVDMEVRLGPLVEYRETQKEDILYTVTNNGDKKITRLGGSLVFYDTSGTEMGRAGILFIHETERLESKAKHEAERARWRALLPGQTMKSGYNSFWLFAMQDNSVMPSDVGQKIIAQWDRVTVSAIIEEVVVE